MAQTRITPYDILIVDDTPHNLTVLRQILSQCGYRIRPAINGEVALKAIQIARPDLILLDIMMPPGMNGYEVCSHLKSDPATQDIPVLFISALDETIDKIKAFEVGGLDYIIKPFQAEEVLARVETHLKLRTMQVTLQEQNEQLRIAKNTAESANLAKSVFLANMSHELRTPLNAILGFAQLLRPSPNLNEEEQQNLDIIIRSGEHLLTLINQVLDLSKVEAGRMTIHATDFDLASLLEDVVDMFRLRAKHKGLRLTFEKTPNLPVWVKTDAIKLRQVLINLLSNAFKFTETGNVTVRASLNSPSQICLEVEDTGYGIDANDLNAIFEAFTQTTVGQSVQEGTGLGLSISRKFIEMMGGNISVTSQIGQGTTFMCTIPVEIVEAPAITLPLHPRRVIGLAAEQPRYRLLVVDDKWEHRQLLIKMLTAVGFETREAENGLECLNVWDAWSPDLIFMEARMREMTGYQAAQHIREAERKQQSAVRRAPRAQYHAATVIIALSAGSPEEEREVAFSKGCQDFLRKPFRESEIFDAIERHLGVEYLYDDQKTETNASSGNDWSESSFSKTLSDIEPDSKRLSDIEPDIMKTLEHATITADIAALFHAIHDVGDTHPQFAQKLASLADNFEYMEILHIIRTLESQ